MLHPTLWVNFGISLAVATLDGSGDTPLSESLYPMNVINLAKLDLLRGQLKTKSTGFV